MAGLLAWASDVVGRAGQSNEEDDPNSFPLIFTSDQQSYVRELDQKAASLGHSIGDLRLRLPPSDISQRLPHLHAHSLAFNADLSLQLNAHFATKEYARLREVKLQNEDAEYEEVVSYCENKTREKLQEADLLRSKLEEMDLAEKNLITELENAQAALGANQSGKCSELLLVGSNTTVESHEDTEALKFALLEKLENKKKKLGSMEVIVQELEKKWTKVHDNTLKQPSPAQREKMLDKQLHSIIEQLAAKQAQAEGVVSEIHRQEMELERVNGLWMRLETSNVEMNTARSRLGRSSSEKGSFSSDYIVDLHQKPCRNENLQRLMLLRAWHAPVDTVS